MNRHPRWKPGPWRRMAAAVCLAVLPGWAASAVAAEKAPADITEQVDGWVDALDAKHFQARLAARFELERALADGDIAEQVAAALRRRLKSPTLPFETRARLVELLADAPEAEPELPERVSPEELDRLVSDLEHATFSVREGAARRLKWLVKKPGVAGPVLERVKERMAAAPSLAALRDTLEPVYTAARQALVQSNPATWDLSPISDKEIQSWLDELATSLPAKPSAADRLRQHLARRQIDDALLRKECVKRIKEGLDERLAKAGLELETEMRLKELRNLARPGLIAEYWESGGHRGIQYLHLGVPSYPELAGNASHFDPVNDEKCVCVEGNSLIPGEFYHYGIAIPHPRQPGALFHLVYLPTPLDRARYEFEVKRPEEDRKAEMSRRTLAKILADKKPLVDPEDLIMIQQLDYREISSFAGNYFLKVDDERFPIDGRYRPGGARTMHGALCVLLASGGTKEAGPGLVKAIEKDRFLDPGINGPLDLPRIAALAIALRDSWEGVDAWLAERISSEKKLVHDATNRPELGATAAALLLMRKGERPGDFGLNLISEARLRDLRCPGFVFENEEARAKVLKWWETEGKTKPTETGQPELAPEAT